MSIDTKSIITVLKNQPFPNSQNSFYTNLSNFTFNKLYAIESNQPGEILGNHYHKIKIEYLYIISGSIDIYCRESNGVTDTIECFSVKKNDLITISPLITHAILIKETNTHFLEFYNNDYSIDGPDMYHDKLI